MCCAASVSARRNPYERIGEVVAPADDLEAHVLSAQMLRLPAQIASEEAEQRDDLPPGPLPVVGGEGVERERADSLVGRHLDDAPDASGAVAMSPLPPTAARLGPAAVPVHDDRDV